MLVTTKMMYLGIEPKTSNKTGKSYLMAKFMERETSAVYEFYVPSDKLKLVTDMGQLSQFTEVGVKLEISSYKGEPRIDLHSVGAVSK